MSHTVNTRSRTRPTSTIQRGKQGRGHQKNHTQNYTSRNNQTHQLQNCNIGESSFENPRIRNNEIYENNKFPNNRGQRRPERGGQTRNYNPETNGTFIRSHSSGSYSSKNETSYSNSNNERKGNSFLPKEAIMFNSDSSRLPKHAKNPIFVNELMQRFDSIMPTSSLLSNAPQQHIRDKNNKTLENPSQSFASISNNVIHGFRNNHSRNSSNPLGESSHQEINRNQHFNYSSNNTKNCSEIVDNKTIKAKSFNKANYRNTNKGGNPARVDYSIFSNEEVSKAIESSNISSKDSICFTKNPTISNQTTGWDKKNPGLDLSKFNAKDKTESKGQQKWSGENYVKMPLQNMAEHLPEHDIRHSKHDQKPKMLSTKKTHPLVTSKVKNLANIEMRNQILAAHGFEGKNNGNDNINCSKENTMNARESSLGETLFSQIKEFNSGDKNSFKHKGEIDKSQNNIKSRIPYCGQQSIQQQFDLPKQIENFNNFLTSQHTKENRLPDQGTPHFNINQSAANPNQRVPTRYEAIQRFEEEYTIKRLEHEAREREKNAIKREQYLAKYKHVDQGHRLDDGYLDEAVGYDPGVALFESEEDVRNRQQEQLRQSALIFQHFEKEKNDQRKKKDEEIKRQRLNKQLQNMDVGYTLGSSDNPGPSQGARPKMRSFDVLERQDRKEHQKLEDDEIRKVSLAKLLVDQEIPIKNKTNPVLTGNSQMVVNQLASIRNTDQSKVNSAVTESVEKPIQNNAAVEIKQTRLNDNDNKETIKLQLQAKLENLMSQSATSSENEIIVQSKSTEATRPLQPASCIIRTSSQGADGVLVLRPTKEILNQALDKKLEVIDLMDKHGDSALYQPQIQPAPLYANNRFQQEPVADISKATEAMHNQKPQVQVVYPPSSGLTSSSSIQNSSVSNQKTVQDVRSIDFVSEMRAARLRMQQKYEESLKKKQENP